ncbi:MAG: hypothetical protein QW474_03000 [Candidatus Aenigmatarchaeota archaeon]
MKVYYFCYRVKNNVDYELLKQSENYKEIDKFYYSFPIEERRDLVVVKNVLKANGDWLYSRFIPIKLNKEEI